MRASCERRLPLRELECLRLGTAMGLGGQGHGGYEIVGYSRYGAAGPPVNHDSGREKPRPVRGDFLLFWVGDRLNPPRRGGTHESAWLVDAYSFAGGFMNIPRYWARASQPAEDRDGHRFAASVWRWSNVGVEEAQRLAGEAARQLAERFRLGEVEGGRYAFYDRPMREEIVEEIHRDGDEPQAVITRNSYGSLVLNTARVAFIDVDVPREAAGAGLVRAISSLWGSRRPTPTEAVTERINAWLDRRPQFSGRLYRTRAGYRLMITNQFVEPVGSTAIELLDQLGADPLYRKLCKVQECFRARLTPKYWRCGGIAPPNRYPWDSAEAEQTYRRWQQQYEQTAAGYATCALEREFGRDDTMRAITPVLEIHDRLARVDSNLPLA